MPNPFTGTRASVGRRAVLYLSGATVPWPDSGGPGHATNGGATHIAGKPGRGQVSAFGMLGEQVFRALSSQPHRRDAVVLKLAHSFACHSIDGLGWLVVVGRCPQNILDLPSSTLGHLRIYEGE